MTSPLNTTDHGTDEPDPHSHLWPDTPAPARGWVDHAKCKNGDLRQYDPVGRPNKQKLAAKLCAGCPVIRQCAQDALHYKDQGVIRAATFIPNHAAGVPMLPGLIARLERIAGTGQAAAA